MHEDIIIAQTTAVASDLTERLPFFVYGTLRTGQRNWSRLLKGRTVSERPASAPGQMMYSTGLAFVTDRDGYTVKGDLMTVKPRLYARLLRELDALEGYDPRAPQRSFYVRVAREVEVDGKRVRAWVYHAGGRTLERLTDADIVASGDWLEGRRQRG